MNRIAIIGAGISGLVLAQQLSAYAEVVIFEKARGVGGRMSTRYADPFYFDHGVQCFTARTETFQSFLKPYIAEGIVSQWKGEIINLEIGKKQTKRLWSEPHLVASPNMNSLCKSLADGLTIYKSCEIRPLDQNNNGVWDLHDIENQFLGKFHWVISTAPPKQTLSLFNDYIHKTNPLYLVSMQGCYALMIGFKKPWDKKWIAAKAYNNPIRWVSVNSTKPGRDMNMTCFVVHVRNDWSEKHINDELDDVKKFLLEQFKLVTSIDTINADFLSIHRWRFATVDKTEKSGSYIDSQLGIAATSDWCQTSRIEEVWQHANLLAEQVRKKII